MRHLLLAVLAAHLAYLKRRLMSWRPATPWSSSFDDTVRSLLLAAVREYDPKFEVR